MAVWPIEQRRAYRVGRIRVCGEAGRREIMEMPGSSPAIGRQLTPSTSQTYQSYKARKKQVTDPTLLIVVRGGL